MEIHQLQYMKEIARQESFSKAAETLHITQSALSKSIAKLENEIGVKLFSRLGNRVQINEFGKVLLRYGEAALINLDSGLAEVRSMADLDSRRVRIGCCAEVFIKHLVQEFLLSHPDTSVQCFLQTNEQMAASLSQGTIDFCFTVEPVVGDNLITTTLYEDHLTMLMSKEHPLANRDGVYLKEFSEDRFIISNQSYGMHSNTYDICRSIGFEPKILYEGYDTEIAGTLVEHNLAVEITPYSISCGVARFLGPEGGRLISIVPLLDDFAKKPINLVTAKGHYLSPAAKCFAEEATKYFRSMTQV